MKITRATALKRAAGTNRIGIIAAVVFLALLVGSMAVVLNFAHHGAHSTTISSRHTLPQRATPTALPTTAGSPTTTPRIPADIGKIVYTTPSTQSFSAVMWSPDGHRLVGFHNSAVEAWDATTGKHVKVYVSANTSGCILGPLLVAWSPDGKEIATGSTGVSVWDTSSGKLLATYPHTNGNGLPIHAGCSSMSTPVGPVFQGSNPSSTKTFAPLIGNIPSGSIAPLLSMVWSPNGQEIADSIAYGMDGSLIQIWDTTTGNLVKTYQDARYTDGLAWSPNGKYFAFGDYGGIVQVWNATTWQPIITYYGDGSSVNTLAWSPDSTRIISAGNTVMVWSALTGQTLFTLPGNTNGVYNVAWSPDGTQVVTAVNHVQLWNAATGKAIYTFTKNPYVIDKIAWSPNGKYIASTASPPGPAGGNGIVQIWIA